MCFCEFARFAETYRFEHRTSSPIHHQGNRDVQQAVITVKRLLKKSSDPYIAMRNSLSHQSGQTLRGR